MKNEKNINELNMDYQTYKKISGTLNPKDKKDVTITSDKPNINSLTSSNQVEENELSGADDILSIKYLSNVKDSNNKISKPFIINDKKYQMVRGIDKDKRIILGVFSFDDFDKNGNNIIFTKEYFEEKIAKPLKGKEVLPEANIDNFDYPSYEREFHDKESFMDFLNLADIDPVYKHFFVNIKNGKIMAKFKNTKEMIKSGVKLGSDEDYMDIKTLKKFRFNEYFKSDEKIEEENNASETDKTIGGVNVEKLKTDVKKLATLIKNKFSIYLTKLDKPIEQAQFLTAMAKEIGVPLNKLNSIITSYKDIAKQETNPDVNEIISKKKLEESLRSKKIIKVKDLI